MYSKPTPFSLKPCLITLLVLAWTTLLAEKLNYDYAIMWAREGAIKRALHELETLQRNNPQNQQLLYDYITVLGWDNNDDKVLALQNKISLTKAPHYVLQHVAKAARNRKKFGTATAFYHIGIKRFPNNPQFYIGLAMTLYDNNKTAHANQTLARAAEHFKHDDAVLYNIAQTYEYKRIYFEALRLYQDLITRPPFKEKAIVNMVGVLRRLKMPFQAQSYVDAYPHLFDSQSVSALRADEAAYELRWALKGYYDTPDNRPLLLSALAKINANLVSFNLNDPESLKMKIVQNGIFDKTTILNALGRTKAAIALYRCYAAEGLSFPPYALTAVADAYLSNKNPQIAEKLLEQVLTTDPNNFKAKILLFYAYSDGYKMHRALDFAKAMDAKELPTVWDRQHQYKQTNPRKLETTILQILSLEYAGYMNAAQKQLEALTAKAPASSWLRNTLAQLYYYRGWYDKALQEYTIVHHFDATDFTARAGIIRSTLMQRRYALANTQMQTLQEAYPFQQKALQELRKTYHALTQGGFDIQSRFGDTPTQSSAGSASGYALSSRLYSPLISEHYRLFLDARRSYEKLYGNRLQNNRYGMGLSYTDATVEASLLLGYNADTIKRFAPSLTVSYFCNDYVRLQSGYELFSPHTPLRGIVQGIRADRLFATLTYRHSDAQESAVTLEQVDFTDGNMRYALSLRHFNRLVEGPYYNLDAYIYSGISDNSKENTPYYNPDQDAYGSLEAKNSWMLYKFYDFSIKQILGIEAGIHWENAYGSNMTGVFSVAQEWHLNERLGFDVGYLRKRSSYDGNIEYKNEFYLTINGRF